MKHAADLTARVDETVEVARDFYRTRLAIDLEPEAGQFLQLRPRSPRLTSPYLRIPLSIAAAGEGWVDVLYEEVGPKTFALSQQRTGDEVGCLGPLGHPFPLPPAGTTPVLVGGGIGVPPLIFFGQTLRDGGAEPLLLVGARSADKHLPDDLLTPAAAAVRRATDDGSLGHDGLVTDLLDEALRDIDAPAVYTCGPHGMMAAVAARCAEADVSCQASLEEYMACGFGVCVGCVVERADKEAQPSAYGHYARVCVDGPVFDARTIVW
jgi:dihydroorotate dehydrogenase electron transfer subunit